MAGGLLLAVGTFWLFGFRWCVSFLLVFGFVASGLFLLLVLSFACFGVVVALWVVVGFGCGGLGFCCWLACRRGRWFGGLCLGLISLVVFGVSI